MGFGRIRGVNRRPQLMASTAKTVLVSYLEKNKRISIPIEKAESDLVYLHRRFLEQFKFDSNVRLDITFQKLIQNGVNTSTWTIPTK